MKSSDGPVPPDGVPTESAIQSNVSAVSCDQQLENPASNVSLVGAKATLHKVLNVIAGEATDVSPGAQTACT